MKQLTSYNRVAGYLNKVFDILNEEFFECELSRPTITIQSTPKAYGHFSLREDTWISKVGGTHEINIGAGTLSRPIEEVAATLLHEMVWKYEGFRVGSCVGLKFGEQTGCGYKRGWYMWGDRQEAAL